MPWLSEADDCPEARPAAARGSPSLHRKTQVCPCLTDRNLPIDDEKRVLPRSLSPSSQVFGSPARLICRKNGPDMAKTSWRCVLVACTKYKIEIETCFDTQTRGWSTFAQGKRAPMKCFPINGRPERRPSQQFDATRRST